MQLLSSFSTFNDFYMIPTCKICKINTADKDNSHIIPKFMSKRLFENSRPRHSIAIDKSGKQKKLQDTPKENKIFCKSCESRIEKLETYFSKFFIDVNSLSNPKRDYTIGILHDHEAVFCNDLHPTLFKLFIFSLVWRCSISNLGDFENFKLDALIEEELRRFLNSNLKSTHSELMQSLHEIQRIPYYHFCITKPKSKTRGIYTSFNFAPDSYLMFTVDYAIFFYTTEVPYVALHEFFSNRDNGVVKIMLGDDDSWMELIRNVLKMMI